MTDIDCGGDYINALIMDRMLLDQKKKYQVIMKQQNKEIAKLKRTVGTLYNAIKFLKTTNENCAEKISQFRDKLLTAKIIIITDC